MKTTVSGIRKDSADFFVRFLTEAGEQSFVTEEMISGEDAAGFTDQQIVSLAWGRVRRTVEAEATRLESAPEEDGEEPGDDLIGTEPIADQPHIAKIRISGSTMLSATVTAQYTTTVLDQYGVPMESSESINWALSPAVEGVEIDSTGILTLQEGFGAQASLTITAQVGGVEGTLTVTVSPAQPALSLQVAEQEQRLADVELALADLYAGGVGL